MHSSGVPIPGFFKLAPRVYKVLRMGSESPRTGDHGSIKDRGLGRWVLQLFKRQRNRRRYLPGKPAMEGIHIDRHPQTFVAFGDMEEDRKRPKG
jgi:hypothetical protein